MGRPSSSGQRCLMGSWEGDQDACRKWWCRERSEDNDQRKRGSPWR